MSRAASRLVLIPLGLALFGCSNPDAPPVGEALSGSASMFTPTPTAVVSSDPPLNELPKLADITAPLTIEARSNIFAAGRTPGELPEFAPGGGGAGEVPPGWQLPPGAARVVTFPSVTGLINPWLDQRMENGPTGDHSNSSDIESLRGISGVISRKNSSFLVGVFLTDELPKDPAPPRLDVTVPPPRNFAPLIAQVFYIGDGKGRRFTVPRGATRLFLGTADAEVWVGPPGYYGNNRGQFEATIAIQAN